MQQNTNHNHTRTVAHRRQTALLTVQIGAFLFALAIGFVFPAPAAPLSVVMTGDSIASATGTRMQSALNRIGIDAVANTVAWGGSTSGRYVGREVNPHLGYAHSFIDDALAYNPDVVILNLGVNNSFQNQMAEYATDLSYILDTFAAHGVKVILGGLIPVLPNPTSSSYDRVDQEIRTFYNPYLQLQAKARGLVFVENYNAIQQQVGWKNWYSEDGVTPGYVHLYGGGPSRPGYTWLANQYAAGIAQLYAGDANLDGRVDGADYVIWSNHLKQPGKFRDGDFNLDGMVDGADYIVWANRFSSQTGNAALTRASQLVPEAGGATLALCGLLTLIVPPFARRRLTRRA
jgi:hypothetical protein